MPDSNLVVVTGASRGLGRSAALDLARRGFTVVAGVRRPEDGAALRRDASGDLRPVILDVAAEASIAAAAGQVREMVEGAGIAGLVNNAAVFLLGPLEQTPLTAVEELFRVNLLGVVAVTQAFLPLLRTGRGRIVNVSSVNGRLGFPFSSFYSASKFAIEGLSDALRVELAPWGIEVVVVEPGVTRTDIRAAGARAWAARREAASPEERALYDRAFRAIQQVMPSVDGGAADHDDFTAAVHQALTAPEPATRYPTGPDAAQFLAMAALPDRERDAAFAAMFSARP